MKLWFAIPGDLNARTGGYGYDRMVIAELRALGHEVEVLHWEDDFPMPDLGSLAQAHESLRAIPDGGSVLIDGLAFSAMPGVVAAEANRLNLVALVHHPLCLENGLTEADAAKLDATERAALPHARRIIVTSPETAREVAARFHVPSRCITSVPPGCSWRRRAHIPERPRILSVGSLIPRKGFDTLLAALACLKDLDWHARIVGSDSADPALARTLRRQAEDAGIQDRVEFVGAVETVEYEMMTASIFALASRYEGYGMAFAEAMAHGLPIVGCGVAAVSDLVPEEAGFLVPPDNPDAFAGALRRLIESGELLSKFSDGAWKAGQSLPTWSDAAKTIVASIETARHEDRIGHIA